MYDFKKFSDNLRLYDVSEEKIKELLDFFLSEKTREEFGMIPLDAELRIDLDGDEIYAIIKKYKTNIPNKGTLDFEAHRRYIDVHLVLQGIETLVIKNQNHLIPISEYDEDQDLEFFVGHYSGKAVSLSESDFYIIFPGQAHLSGLSTDGGEEVLKAVIKIAV